MPSLHLFVFDPVRVQRIITQPAQSARAYPGPLAMGIAGMSFMMFMRARFYWWPIHSMGLLRESPGWTRRPPISQGLPGCRLIRLA